MKFLEKIAIKFLIGRGYITRSLIGDYLEMLRNYNNGSKQDDYISHRKLSVVATKMMNGEIFLTRKQQIEAIYDWEKTQLEAE